MKCVYTCPKQQFVSNFVILLSRIYAPIIDNMSSWRFHSIHLLIGSWNPPNCDASQRTRERNTLQETEFNFPSGTSNVWSNTRSFYFSETCCARVERLKRIPFLSARKKKKEKNNLNDIFKYLPSLTPFASLCTRGVLSIFLRVIFLREQMSNVVKWNHIAQPNVTKSARCWWKNCARRLINYLNKHSLVAFAFSHLCVKVFIENGLRRKATRKRREKQEDSIGFNFGFDCLIISCLITHKDRRWRT